MALDDHTIRQDYMETNYGTIVMPEICAYNWLGDIVSAYSLGNDVPGRSIGISQDAANLPRYSYDDFITMLTPHTDEDIESEEYQEALQRFEANTGWVWGDIHHGGLFFLKDQNDLIHFGVLAGYGEYTSGIHEGEKSYYGNISTYSGAAFNVIECAQVTIVHEEVSDPDALPTIGILTSPAITGMQYLDTNSDDPQWTATQSIDVAMADCLYKLDLPSIQLPNRIWTNEKDQILTLGTFPENFSVIGLDWRGESSINPEDDPSIPGGDPQEDDTRGEYPTKSDEVPLNDPNKSGVDATNTGFITIYNPTAAQVKAFNNYIFSDNITDAISTALKKLIADPIDYVVFIALCRFHPTYSGVVRPIKFCGLATGVSARVCKPQFKTIDYGTLEIPNASNSFADYGGYSKAYVRLPYCGTHELNINEVMGSKLHLEYIIDQYTGACLARIHVQRSARTNLFNFNADAKIDAAIYEYTGNCFEMLPLSATDFRNTFSSIAQFAVGMGSVITGNIAGFGAMGSAVMNASPNVKKSGETKSSYGYMGVQDPFVILERPIQALPSTFYTKRGGFSNMSKKLSSIAGSGYTEVYGETLNLTGLSVKDANENDVYATQNEIDEIRSILSGGFYI